MLLCFILTAYLVGCSVTEKTEIKQRWPNGETKTMVTYHGEGENRVPKVTKTYSAGGILFEVI